jgi:hypothetical protein
MSEIIKFPDRAAGANRTSEIRGMVRKVLDEELYPSSRVRTGCGRPYTRRGKNIQTLLFRRRDLILECSDAELVRDVSLDIEKAAMKLEKTRERRQRFRATFTEEDRRLEAVEIKLASALVAAMLSQAERPK